MHNLKLCSNKNFTVIYQKKKKRHSFATNTESVIWRPWTNAFWEGEIITARALLKRLAKTFVKILYTLLTKLIG